MTLLNGTPVKVNTARERKDISKRLGIALGALYRRVLESENEEQAVAATLEIANVFDRHAEFIIWVLKEYGGAVQKPYTDPTWKRRSPPPPAANDLPKLDTGLTGVLPPGECTCPPPEPGIIQAKGHMTSCPLYEP